MDPNATLEEIRSLILRCHEGSPEPFAARFFQLVEALDRWLSVGNAKPIAWAGETAYTNPVSGRLKRLDTLEDLFARLGKSHPASRHERERINRVIEAHPGAEALVVFECLQMDSSSFGNRTTVVVGPGCSYESIEQACSKHLYDLPSQRQYPVAYYRIGGADVC